MILNVTYTTFSTRVLNNTWRRMFPSLVMCNFTLTRLRTEFIEIIPSFVLYTAHLRLLQVSKSSQLFRIITFLNRSLLCCGILSASLFLQRKSWVQCWKAPHIYTESRLKYSSALQNVLNTAVEVDHLLAVSGKDTACSSFNPKYTRPSNIQSMMEDRHRRYGHFRNSWRYRQHM